MKGCHHNNIPNSDETKTHWSLVYAVVNSLQVLDEVHSCSRQHNNAKWKFC